MEKLFTRKEAAELLGISITTLDAARNEFSWPMCMFPMAAFSLPAPVSRNMLPNVHTEQSLVEKKTTYRNVRKDNSHIRNKQVPPI